MMTVRKSEDRGRYQADWLESRHTFSFDTYYDPNHMGFRTLRVINEDFVQPGTGFPLHPHRDMEIVTFIVEGVLEHQDDLGNRGEIRSGEVQRITAGSGIRHSEANAGEGPVHLLQIWILPREKGLVPDYEQRSFADSPPNSVKLLVSPDGRRRSARLNQDAFISFGILEGGADFSVPIDKGRHAWLQMIDGDLSVNGTPLATGDGIAISEEATLELAARRNSRFILFDLA